MYEPSDRIFEQGEASPDLYLIIYGTVCSTMKRGDWQGSVTVQL